MATRKPYAKSWPRKNLGELIGFIDRQYPEGYSLKMLSSDLGMSEQYLSQFLTKDDTKLSRAEDIARKYGYTLRLYFPQREYVFNSNGKEKNFPNAKNLTGLVKYLADSNISINYMSQRIDKANNVITNAFRKGDIMISTLYLIIKNLNIEILWEFEKTENN